MSDRQSSHFAPTRGALRTLQVLRALNVRNGATVVQLSRDTGISRAALYRILETLREAGYVALDLSGRQYCLTVLVRSLADGFTDEDWVTAVAKPALKALQKEILWPADLGTFMDNAMFIRETTRHVSSLTIDRGVAGARFPLLKCASGRAYLAWCPDKEREQILRNLVSACEPGYELALDRPRLDGMLQATRERGYGQRYNEEPTESGAISTPIRLRDRVLGCVTITFMRRAMTPEEAARRYLKTLTATAAEIASGAMRMLEDEAPALARAV